MDLVLTKWIALKGTSVLASCRAEELSSRFPSVMIRDAAGYLLSVHRARVPDLRRVWCCRHLPAWKRRGIRRALEYAGADKCRYGN